MPTKNIKLSKKKHQTDIILPDAPIHVDNEKKLREYWNKQDIKDSSFEIPKKKSRIYSIGKLILIAVFLIWLVSVVGLVLFSSTHPVVAILLVILLVLTIPVFFITLAFVVGKLYLDKRKIMDSLYKKYSNNYIIARIFSDNRSYSEHAYGMDPSGKSFMANDGLYTVDKECVWFDDMGQPHSDYVRDIPCPLKYGFESGIKAFFEEIKDLMINEGNDAPTEFLEVNVSYSSTNLALLMKDKFLRELHDPEGDTQKTAILMLIGGLILGIVLTLIIVFILKGSATTNVTIVQNATQAAVHSASQVVVQG